MLRVLAPRLLPKGYSLNHATNVLVTNQKCVPTWSLCPTRDLSSGKLGPDRLLPATSFTTTDSNGAVQIRTHDHPSSEYPTKSVYTWVKEVAWSWYSRVQCPRMAHQQYGSCGGWGPGC